MTKPKQLNKTIKMVFTFDLPCPELFFSNEDHFDFHREDHCCFSTVWFSFSQKVCANVQWVFSLSLTPPSLYLSLSLFGRKDVWNEFCGDTPHAQNFRKRPVQLCSGLSLSLSVRPQGRVE